MWRNASRLFFLVSLTIVGAGYAVGAGRVGAAAATSGLLTFTCTSCKTGLYHDAIGPDGRRLRLYAADGSGARLSPDRKTVAYWVDGQIWVRALPIWSTPRKLAHPPQASAAEGDSDVAWFPNGTRLVFVRSKPAPPPQDVQAALWTASAAGRGAKLLFAWASPAGHPSPVTVWDPEVSHDGRRIAFDASGRLWVIGADGSGLRRLGPPGLLGRNPRWSPDDTKVAYLNQSGALSILDLRTNEYHLILFGPKPNNDPQDGAFSWSPSGRWLAVDQAFDYDCGDPTGACQGERIWLVNPTTGAARHIYRPQTDFSITSIDWR